MSAADLMPFTYEGAELDRLPTAHQLHRNAVGAIGYVYVIEFATGTIKVGSTKNPRHRIGTHAVESGRFGSEIRRVALSRPHPRFIENEATLLSFAQNLTGTQIVTGREYFTGCRFEDIVERSKNLDFTALDAMEIGRQLLGSEERSAGLKRFLHAGHVDGVRVTLGDDVVAWVVQLLLGKNSELPTLSSGDASDLDAIKENLDRLSELSGISLIELSQWTYLDVLRYLGHQQVEIGFLRLTTRALEGGRTDLVRPGYYDVDADGFVHWSAPDMIPVDGGNIVVGAGESMACGERALVRVERGGKATDTYLTCGQVDQLIEMLTSAREALGPISDVNGGAS